MSAYEGMSFADLLLARQGDQRTALLFEDERHSWDDVVRASAVRAALARDRLDPARSPHVGVLLENTPEYLYWLGGAALERVTAVGINPTRRGAELARDVRHTDCQLIVTNREHLPLLDLDGIGLRRDQVLVVDDEPYLATLAEQSDTALPVTAVQPDDRLLLLFTSGSTGGPKAVICSQGRIVRIVDNIQRLNDLSSTTVAYLSMPMFHGNALMVNVTPMVALGGTIAMRRRFSASGFLPDVRRFGATFFNYVGRALAYVLATPEHPDDADNTLQVGFGTEASHADRERFERRFGCRLVESYGCSEGDVHINPTPGMPAGALGRALPGTEVAIVNPDTGRECEPARFDAGGALANGEAALGELVARGAAGRFEGYYNNPEATSRRIRGGDVWTGDFGYRDADGFIYFAGRSADLLRVDSENFAAAPVERILLRQPGVVMCAVYAVPDARTGDQVMAALELTDGRAFDPVEFEDFLRAQPDLGKPWAPRFVRVVEHIPLTPTSKVLKGPLRREAWRTDDPMWWRRGRELRYEPFTAADRADLERELAAHGRMALVGA